MIFMHFFTWIISLFWSYEYTTEFVKLFLKHPVQTGQKTISNTCIITSISETNDFHAFLYMDHFPCFGVMDTPKCL